jgi:1,4-dihydroxy-2-naphthoate polyprenyltransferase
MSLLAQPGVRETVRHRFPAYVKLAKLSFFDYYLCVLVVWTLLPTQLRSDVSTYAVLIAFDLGWVGVVAATVTLDDVTGFRDGSDERNYSPDQTELRNRGRKPLLDGVLTVGQALRFGYLAAAWGVAMWALSVLVAPHQPVAAAVLAAVSVLISVQYSYGLRLSYRGFQEAVILVSTGLSVLIPAWLLIGKATGITLVEAYLFGIWSLLVSVYSNINDAEGDKAAGRRNLVTRMSAATYRRAVMVLTLTEPVAIMIGLATRAVPWYFVLFLIPVLCLRVRQLRTGLLRDNPLVARKLGIKIHRLGVVLLLAANVAIIQFS